MHQLVTRLRVAWHLTTPGRQGRRTDEAGATAVEYGLMVSLIAGVIVLAVTALGVRVTGLFEAVVAAIGG